MILIGSSLNKTLMKFFVPQAKYLNSLVSSSVWFVNVWKKSQKKYGPARSIIEIDIYIWIQCTVVQDELYQF